MAPVKGIRTYSNKNKKPGSKLALDNLLANNIRKRLETSINSPGTSRNQSSESTFDRLLKGEVYNNVVFKKFPDNNFNTNENSASSVFSRTNDSFRENNQTELNSSIKKSLLSPVVILERNLEKFPISRENKKTVTPQHHKSVEESRSIASGYSSNISFSGVTETQNHNDVETLQEVDTVISQLHNCQKMILMNSLQLHQTPDKSNYLDFRNSVDTVSTPQFRNNNYYLRKHIKNKNINQELSDFVSHNSAGKTDNSLYDHYQLMQTRIDKLSNIRNEHIQGTQSKPENSNATSRDDNQKHEEREKEILVDDFRESPRTSSTPLPAKRFRHQDQSATSLLSKSFKIINDWSLRCPTPNSFNNTPQHRIEGESRSDKSWNLHKRKRDTKLFKKSRVILKYNSLLEEIIKDELKKKKSHDMTFLNVKTISNNHVSRRKRKRSMKNTHDLKNCAVYLTHLNEDNMKKFVESPEIINISSENSLTQILELNKPQSSFYPDEDISTEGESPSLESKQKTKRKSMIKDNSLIGIRNTSVRSKFSDISSEDFLLQISESDKSQSPFYSDEDISPQVESPSLQSKQQTKRKPKIKQNSLIGTRKTGIESKLKHKCSDKCEHFKKIPKVIIERNINCSDKKSLRDLSSFNNSQDDFRGFNANSENHVNSISSKGSHDLGYNFKTDVDYSKKTMKTHGQFKMKDCYVKLDQMIIPTTNDENKEERMMKENNRKWTDCSVTLSDNKGGNKSRASSSEKPVQELSSASSFNKPTSTQNSFDYIRLPTSQSLINDCDVFREPIQIRKFISLATGKKFRRSIAVLKKNSDNSENIASSSQMTIDRRQSVKLIPLLSNKKKISELASIALNNSGYVSLRQSFRRSSLEKVENYLPNVQPVENYLNYITNNTADQITARDIVLKRCGQTEPLKFEKCYPTSVLQHCQKIGEGVFGEVFMIRDKDGSTTVVKVIPIEGEQIVNLEKQKTFEEIISEIIISMELSNLDQTKRNNTDAFVKVKGVRCVQGCYPDRLLELWELYDENKQSENDSPQIFLEDQLYIVIELANAGQDLEAFQFNNAQQALAVFEQVTCALAVAESELQFEHRDLHWGNVLITATKEQNTVFVLDGKEIIIKNRGTKATIIDFTLSRVEYDGVIIFNDLSMDEDLFTAKGDYQFDIYRKMQENNGNQWESFKPYSNILWLHYILDKALNGFRYKNAKSKLHKTALAILKAYEQKILESNSATEFVLNNFISNTLNE